MLVSDHSGANLAPGAKALIATCVVTAVVVFLLGVFAVSKDWTGRAFVTRDAVLRGLGRHHRQSETGHDHAETGVEMYNSATVLATDGGTDRQAVASVGFELNRFWRFFPLRSVHFHRSRLPRADEHDEGFRQATPTPGTEGAREDFIARTGSVFEDVTVKRPEELDDLDLV